MRGCSGRLWWRRDERGVALVEFAVCLPLLAVLGLGTVDLGRAYVMTEQARNAAREAALYAAAHPGQLHNVTGTSCADPANADWRGNAEAGNATYSFSYSTPLATGACNPSPLPAGLQPGQPLRVTASRTFTLLTPVLGGVLPKSLSVSASVCVNVAGTPSTTACP